MEMKGRCMMNIFFLILYSFMVEKVGSSSIYYKLVHDTSHDLPVKAEYGYITFTVKGGNVLNFDISNESGNPYFRAILSSFGALSIYALNVSLSDVGSGDAEDGDGGPVMSRNEYSNLWIRWSPYELSVGRGLAVDSGLIESEIHPAPVEQTFNLRVFTHGPGNYAWLTVHYETTLLNECLLDNITCDAGKECVDYVGGYSCECPAGKTGNDCDQDALTQMSTFDSIMDEMLPVFQPYKTMDTKSLKMCAIWCQREVDCVTFSATPSHAGSFTCFMYDRRPLSFDHQPQAGVVTMELLKTAYH